MAERSRICAAELMRREEGSRRIHYRYVKLTCLREWHVMKDAVMHLLHVTSPNSDLQ